MFGTYVSAKIVGVSIDEAVLDAVAMLDVQLIASTFANAAFRVVLPKNRVPITPAKPARIDAVEIAGKGAMIYVGA